MLDVPIEMMPSTAMSDLDLALASGGFEGGGPIDGGGGGPSSGEASIHAIYDNWNGDIISNDGTTAYTDDGAMFYDSDGNGYFDYLELATESGVWVYDPMTDTWTWRQHDDRDPD